MFWNLQCRGYYTFIWLSIQKHFIGTITLSQFCSSFYYFCCCFIVIVAFLLAWVLINCFIILLQKKVLASFNLNQVVSLLAEPGKSPHRGEGYDPHVQLSTKCGLGCLLFAKKYILKTPIANSTAGWQLHKRYSNLPPV